LREFNVKFISCSQELFDGEKHKLYIPKETFILMRCIGRQTYGMFHAGLLEKGYIEPSLRAACAYVQDIFFDNRHGTE
jgi:hypothetical protein